MPDPGPLPRELVTTVERVLKEDIGRGDLTTGALVDDDALARAEISFRERAVVAGGPVAEIVFRELDLVPGTPYLSTATAYPTLKAPSNTRAEIGMVSRMALPLGGSMSLPPLRPARS